MKKVLFILITVLVLPIMVNAKTYDGVGFDDGNFYYNGDIIKNIKGLPLEEVKNNYKGKQYLNNNSTIHVVDAYTFPTIRVNYYEKIDNNGNLSYEKLSQYYTEDYCLNPSYDEATDTVSGLEYSLEVGDAEYYNYSEGKYYYLPDHRWILKKYNTYDKLSERRMWRCLVYDFNNYNNHFSISSQYSGCNYGYFKNYDIDLDFYEAPPAEPEVTITCDKMTLKKDESTSCELQITYKYEADELNFSLDTIKSEISDIQLNENWTLNNGVYSIKGDTPEKKEYLSNISKGLKVATFNAKYENTLGETNPEEEIQISIISKEVTVKNERENVVAEDKKVDLTVSDKEIPEEENTPGNEEDTPTDEEEPVENPETGIYDYIAVVSLTIMASVLLYMKIKEISSFKYI